MSLYGLRNKQNFYRMFFADTAIVNSQPVFMKFCKDFVGLIFESKNIP